jgi:8-oxo-dGTP diphosphatase
MPQPEAHPGLAAFSMTLLCCGDQYLMLQRASHKSFAPGLWTGIGGRVEPDEFDDIPASALREIREETGYQPDDIEHFVLRRTLLQQRPGHPATVLFYFTGHVTARPSPSSTEGTLHWKTEQDIHQLGVAIIENTRLVIPLLIEDRRRDPHGTRPQIPGACFFDEQGPLVRMVWSAP